MLTPQKSSPRGFAAVLLVVVTACFLSFWSLRAASTKDCDHHQSLVSVSPLLLGNVHSETLLLCFRLLCAIVCVVTTTVILLDSSDPFEFSYGKARVSLTGIGRAATFTVQTFFLMTAYFVIVALLSFNHVFGLVSPEWLQWPAWLANVLFRILYPVSFLVTLVVTFVLYPTAVKLKLETQITRFFKWPVVVMHAWNSIMINLELLLATPLVDDAHMLGWVAIPVLWGLWYCLFAWVFFMRSGVFFYFFLDWRNSIAPLLYMALLLVLLLLNCLEFFMRWAISGRHVYICVASVAVSAFIGRFRDARK